MIGIKETKEVAVFVARLANGVDGGLADGHVGLEDAFQLVKPLMALPVAVEGVKAVPAEIADLDPAEAEELKAAIAAELTLKSGAVEAVVEQVLGVVLQLVAAIMATRHAKAEAAPVA